MVTSILVVLIFVFCFIQTEYGRPRKTWMEGVRAAMTTRHLEEDQWLNRKEWRLGSRRWRQLSQDQKDRVWTMGGAHNCFFQKSKRATSKFQTPERYHKVSSMLRNYTSGVTCEPHCYLACYQFAEIIYIFVICFFCSNSCTLFYTLKTQIHIST